MFKMLGFARPNNLNEQAVSVGRGATESKKKKKGAGRNRRERVVRLGLRLELYRNTVMTV